MNKNTKSVLTWGAVIGLLYWFWKMHNARKAA